jgi:hypothetical protein
MISISRQSDQHNKIAQFEAAAYMVSAALGISIFAGTIASGSLQKSGYLLPERGKGVEGAPDHPAIIEPVKHLR